MLQVPLHHVDRGDFRASETMEDVRRYRKQNVDCAIVRIMKDRKTLDHEKLVEECKKLCDPYFKVLTYYSISSTKECLWQFSLIAFWRIFFRHVLWPYVVQLLKRCPLFAFFF